MDHLRHHAGQSAAEGDGARRREERHARIGRALGTPACRAQRIRHCGDPGLSVGGCVTAERADGAAILLERRGAAGLVTLNRPQALNAVSLAMVRALTQQLAQWEDDPAITRVIVVAGGGARASAGAAAAGARSRPAAICARSTIPGRLGAMTTRSATSARNTRSTPASNAIANLMS